MKSFYDPTPELLTVLEGDWSAAYSGGKDSSSMVTQIEWLRRAGWVTCKRPQLVQSDTGVEEDDLQELSHRMMAVLTASGWECVIVKPSIDRKLYTSILGRGVPPVHPGINTMRWCTNGTKLTPMNEWRKTNARGVTLIGERLGESAQRDDKIKKRGCSAGGECGIPEANERTFSPIITWTTCQVVDWLNGHVRSDVQSLMGDVFEITRQLVKIYKIRVNANVFDFADPEVTAGRFGCKGCPAITPRRGWVAELYDVWDEARKFKNRLWKNGKRLPGAIRMAVRKVLFDRVIDIQRRSGVVLVTPEDEAYIRYCWEAKIYPRGWSEEDETTEEPNRPLFEEHDPCTT